MKKIIKFVLNSFYVLLVAALVVFGAAVALSVFGKPGNYQLFVVQSASMEPALKKESVVLIEPTNRVKKTLYHLHHQCLIKAMSLLTLRAGIALPIE